MKEKVAQLREQAQVKIESAVSLQELEEIRVKLLGKKGELTEISKGMKNLSPEERPVLGQLVNETREFITNLLETKNLELKEKEKEGTLKSIKVPSSIEIVYVFMSSAILVPVSGLFYA